MKITRACTIYIVPALFLCLSCIYTAYNISVYYKQLILNKRIQIVIIKAAINTLIYGFIDAYTAFTAGQQAFKKMYFLVSYTALYILFVSIALINALMVYRIQGKRLMLAITAHIIAWFTVYVLLCLLRVLCQLTMYTLVIYWLIGIILYQLVMRTLVILQYFSMI